MQAKLSWIILGFAIRIVKVGNGTEVFDVMANHVRHMSRSVIKFRRTVTRQQCSSSGVPGVIISSSKPLISSQLSCLEKSITDGKIEDALS